MPLIYSRALDCRSGRDVSKALLSGCRSRAAEMRDSVACVCRLMDMHACAVLAAHFSVRSCDIRDVIIIGDLHQQHQQLAINTDLVCIGHLQFCITC